eukprot:1779168-Pyramimonas_sp.AAC.1
MKGDTTPGVLATTSAGSNMRGVQTVTGWIRSMLRTARSYFLSKAGAGAYQSVRATLSHPCICQRPGQR